MDRGLHLSPEGPDHVVGCLGLIDGPRKPVEHIAAAAASTGLRSMSITTPSGTRSPCQHRTSPSAPAVSGPGRAGAAGLRWRCARCRTAGQQLECVPFPRLEHRSGAGASDYSPCPATARQPALTGSLIAPPGFHIYFHPPREYCGGLRIDRRLQAAWPDFRCYGAPLSTPMSRPPLQVLSPGVVCAGSPGRLALAASIC